MKTLVPICLLSVVLVGVGTYHSAPATAGIAAEGEVYVVTHVDVMPKFTAAGHDLLIQFAVASRNDSGAVRIEVLEEPTRPNHSTIVEVWKDRKAYDEHLEAEQTRAFRGKLQPMLGSPFDERLHRLTSPATASLR
jgi:quinol monooxygenase YgiN